MMKNLNFIPLNNDIKKLSAFIPSLNKDWRDNQRISSKPYQVESLDAIREFQHQGWNITGALEDRSKNRKVNNHYIRMEHPDFTIIDSRNKKEAVATMNIQNSCNGSKPMELDFGVYRQVCENGMIAHSSFSNAKVAHTEKGLYSLSKIILNLGIHTQDIMNEFVKLKNSSLSPIKAMAMAAEAAKLRFGEDHSIDVKQLLNINRDEDKGEDVWTVFNRIQENLTQPERIYNENGSLMVGVNSIYEDTRINKGLTKLAFQYLN